MLKSKLLKCYNIKLSQHLSIITYIKYSFEVQKQHKIKKEW